MLQLYSGLYDRPEDALRLAEQIGLPRARIVESDSAFGQWWEVLKLAHKQTQIVPLADAIVMEYPGSAEKISAVLAAYEESTNV